MGVRIEGVGTERLSIMGGSLEPLIEYKICPDRIVAGTYLFAVLGTGGEVVLRNAPMKHMKTTLQLAGKLGAELQRSNQDIKISMDGPVKEISYVRTAPYPGFPTDLQSLLVAVLCKAAGESRIEERIFENRFLIVDELLKMGANIKIQDQIAHIYPVKNLYGTVLNAKDLRGGAALVLAALSADGVSDVNHAEIILRGYEDIVKDFEKMGAIIRRIP